MMRAWSTSESNLASAGQVFISYVEEDASIAEAVAQTLEESRIGVWHYQRDSLPGLSYLVQIGRAIDSCEAIVLIASNLSLGSHQVTKEVVRGHDSAKPFVPVLVDITHREFQAQPEWREAVGAASSLSLPRGRPSNTLQRLAEGVRMLLAHNPTMQGTTGEAGRGPGEAPTRIESAGPSTDASPPVPDEVLSRHELNQPFGEESCEYEVALLQVDYPEFYFEETPFNLDAIDLTTYRLSGDAAAAKARWHITSTVQTELVV